MIQLQGTLIDEEDYRHVSVWSGWCLSIFGPRGNKIHTFGNLNMPDGFMIDPKSGSLHVVNYGAEVV